MAAKKDVVTEVQEVKATEVATGATVPVEVETKTPETAVQQEQPAVTETAAPATETTVEVVKEKKHPIKDGLNWLGNHIPKPIKTAAKIAAAGGVIFGAVKLGEHIGKGEGFDEAYSTFVDNFGNNNSNNVDEDNNDDEVTDEESAEAEETEV